ncbi:hypothetical protein PVAND_016079 [Polypedilum vanderplanki]|uniref:Uncharacterized protein n=1 Tax=Polypedilum vanderplanki TaxID=319348 RepID=A0A9J6BET3_POLVA|nr:hypothetical protein PVAND_016079 [Polypedilum vanderplanki]
MRCRKKIQKVIINVQETHNNDLFFTPEMVDIDQSLYDVDPFEPTEVHPFNEIKERKSNIFKEYFGNSSIHGLNYGTNTNLIEKLFWTFFVTLSITFCIIMAFDIKIQKRIVHEDNTNFKRKIPFPAVTFIPSYFIDNEFDVNFKDETDYEKFVRRLENKKFKEKIQNVNDEFKLKRNVSMLNQKSMPKMSKNQYPLKVGVNDRSKFQLHIDESKFNLKQLQRCVLRMIVVHSTDYLATFLDLREFIDIEKSMNIEIVSEFTKTEESLKSQSPKERECYFENERKLKYFKIYSQKHCEMECSMDRLFEEHKCQMVDIIYKERRNFCLEIMHDEKRGILQKDNCSCLPSCNLLTYHVKYFPIESEGNESIITVTMNGEDFILYRRYQLFTFSDIVSYVGGLLGLFAGISVLSIIEIFYYFTLRLGNDILKFYHRFNE